MQMIKLFKRTINYVLLVFLLVIIISLTWHLIPPLKVYNFKMCSKSYPLEETYNTLSNNHQWDMETVPFKGIKSYKNRVEDGISVYSNYEYNKISQKNDLFSQIKYIKNKKYVEFSLGYLNKHLSNIYHYKDDTRDGIYLTFHDTYPSLVVVYSNDVNVGLIEFWDYGRIGGIKFGSNYKDETRESGKDNSTYDNGQKAFQYIEENNIEYWVVYNPKGEMLIKYPIDNDFCKAEFYENGKKVEIPYYFDQKEFEEIYEKIKNDVNKS